MKITKYPQSCLLVESEGKKILIDPGVIDYKDSFFNEWRKADVILITHKHADHCHEEVIKKILKEKEIKIYSSKEVQQAYPNLPIDIVKEGDNFEPEGINIEAVKAVHGYLPHLKGQWEIYENIGFLLTIEHKRIYITSDTVCFNNDYKCDVLAIPVSGHGLVMGPFEAALFAKESGANLVIPFHMDNPKFPTDLSELKNEFEKNGLNYKLMKTGENLEIKL
jgi:L-ascorbate metabolism protein UlaG (beta-lactamase superfamily)